MKKIKVLHVIGTLRIGGAENIAMNFSRYLNKDNYQIDYLVFGSDIGEYEEEAIKLGSKVIHIDAPGKGYIKYMKNLKEVLQKGKYDVIHTHMLLNNGLNLMVANKLNITKRISHSHSTKNGKISENLVYIIYTQLMKKFIKWYSTDYIACGKDAGEYLYGNSLFNKRGIIINNGINIKNYTFNEVKRNKVREEFNIKDEIVIGHIGRLTAVKNHHFLLEIFKKVYDLNPNVLLMIVGDGDLKASIQKKSKELGIEDRVIMTGMRSDVADIVQAIDVSVFPSLYEGLPVAIIEAQASGAPCIVSNTITSEIKVSELVTFLSLEEDPKVWANKVLESVDVKRVDQSKEMKEKGFNVSDTIKQLEKLYDIK